MKFLLNRLKANYGNSDHQKDLTEDSDQRKLPEIVQSLTTVNGVNLEEFWEDRQLATTSCLAFF